jgi:hypothetical protein
MKKLLQDLATMCWILMVGGGILTAIGLFYQFRSGVPSTPIMVSLTLVAVGYISYRLQRCLAILNDRLDNLEKSKPQP